MQPLSSRRLVAVDSPCMPTKTTFTASVSIWPPLTMLTMVDARPRQMDQEPVNSATNVVLL